MDMSLQTYIRSVKIPKYVSGLSKTQITLYWYRYNMGMIYQYEYSGANLYWYQLESPFMYSYEFLDYIVISNESSPILWVACSQVAFFCIL